MTKKASGENLPLKKITPNVERYLRTSDNDLREPHYFSPRHLKMIESYAETLDFKAACSAAGMTPAQVKSSPYLLQEIRLINRNMSYRLRSKTALGNHWRLMEKIERYLDGGNQEMKRSAMSTMARMSEAALRAEGEFGERVDSVGIQGVQVVINIGESLDVPAGPIVDIEGRDGGVSDSAG